MVSSWCKLAAQSEAGPRAVLEAAIAAWLGVVVSGMLEWNLANTEVLHLFLVVAAAASVAAKNVSPQKL